MALQFGNALFKRVRSAPSSGVTEALRCNFTGQRQNGSELKVGVGEGIVLSKHGLSY
jgi:hypothetical protein